MPRYPDILPGSCTLPVLSILVGIHAFSPVAVACTLCHSEAAQRVRAGIFGPDFGFNVFVTVIPFAIFLAITTLLYFGLPGRRRTFPETSI